MFCQQWDVIYSVPERRDLNRKHIQPVKEILAKSAVGHGLLQIPVGGGHNAHIGATRAVVTDPFIAFLLEDAQQFVLNIQRNFSHFIEEDGSAFGRFKASGPVLEGPGKSPADMAKEFAFEQLPWNGSAIDSNQRASIASAALVDFVGDQFFAGSGLAQDEHRSLGGSYQVNLADNVPQGRALPDQVSEGLGLHHGLLQISILDFQLPFEPLDFLKG